MNFREEVLKVFPVGAVMSTSEITDRVDINLTRFSVEPRVWKLLRQEESKGSVQLVGSVKTPTKNTKTFLWKRLS